MSAGVERGEREDAADTVLGEGEDRAVREPVGDGIGGIERQIIRIGSADFLPCAAVQIIERTILLSDQCPRRCRRTFCLDGKGVLRGEGGGFKEIRRITANYAVHIA